MALTRRELDAGRCQTPGCCEDHGPLYLNPRCHPGGGVDVSYVNGELFIMCKPCGKLVTSVEVAEGEAREGGD